MCEYDRIDKIQHHSHESHILKKHHCLVCLFVAVEGVFVASKQGGRQEGREAGRERGRQGEREGGRQEALDS